MSGELATTSSKPGQLIEIAQAQGDDVFGAISTAGGYLPRVQLYGASSEAVKESKIPMAHFGLTLSKENIVDLGKEFDALPIVWRAKAMELGEQILNYYDPYSPEFKRIQELSDVKDSGCMYGPEYLIWVPSQKKFATFFCNSKTARRAAPKLRDKLGCATTFKAVYIKTDKYAWHGPDFLNCSTPFELPDMDDIAEETAKFNNPPKSEVEKVPETKSEGRVR